MWTEAEAETTKEWKEDVADAKVTQVADTEEAWKVRQEALADAMFAMDRDRIAAELLQTRTINDLTAVYQTAATALYATYQVALGDANVAFVAAMAPVLRDQAIAISDANIAAETILVRIAGDRGVVEANNAITALNARDPSTFDDVDPKPDSIFDQAFSVGEWFVGAAGIAIGALVTFTALAIGIPILVAAFPVACTIISAAAAIGFIITAISAASNVAGRFADGQTITQSLGGGVADVTGINGLYIGLTNRDIATGQHQNLTSRQMGASFASGGAQLIGTITAIRGLLRGFCFVADTQVLMGEEAKEGTTQVIVQPGTEVNAGLVAASVCLIVGIISPAGFAALRPAKQASEKRLCESNPWN